MKYLVLHVAGFIQTTIHVTIDDVFQNAPDISWIINEDHKETVLTSIHCTYYPFITTIIININS
jgi:hypothetical protein